MALPLIRINDELPEIESTNERPDISLCSLLHKCAEKHADSRKFWPRSVLEREVTEQRIIQELKRCKGDYDEQSAKACADRIWSRGDVDNRAIKVFAILVLVGKGHEICNFLQESIYDKDLPLINCETENTRHYIFARKETPKTPIWCLKGWKIVQRAHFHLMQCLVDVPFLGFNKDQKIKHEEFRPGTVMPWISFTLEDCGRYGNVYRAEVPKESHSFDGVLKAIEFRNHFAVKELRPLKDEKRTKEEKVNVWKEVEMLSRFSGVFHDHLVTLLMTWNIDDSHYLLFPWAECNLHEYWKSDDRKLGRNPETKEIHLEDIHWISSQIQGMTRALDVIHNPSHLHRLHLSAEVQKFGRHGDLTPENILFYPSPKFAKGIFVITDFGLGSLNSDKSRSNFRRERNPGTPEYRPPECELKGGTISRSFDIWTYGCLLLELVCWALSASERNLRQEFNGKRWTPYITGSQSNIFFDIQKEKADGEKYVVKVKEKVTKYIAGLHAKPTCTQYFHDVLDLIEDEMIIILTPGKERIRSLDLVNRVQDLHKNVKASPSYCQKGCPQTRAPKPTIAFEAELNDTAKRYVMKLEQSGDRLAVHKGEIRTSKSPDELQAMP